MKASATSPGQDTIPAHGCRTRLVEAEIARPPICNSNIGREDKEASPTQDRTSSQAGTKYGSTMCSTSAPHFGIAPACPAGGNRMQLTRLPHPAGGAKKLVQMKGRTKAGHLKLKVNRSPDPTRRQRRNSMGPTWREIGIEQDCSLVGRIPITNPYAGAKAGNIHRDSFQLKGQQRAKFPEREFIGQYSCSLFLRNSGW